MVEKTEIINKAACGYTYFVSVGKMILACGIKGGVKKLDIVRVIVVGDSTKRRYTFLDRLGLGSPTIKFDVDVDIYLADGSIIEVHSSEPKFLKKLTPYIWELKRRNPRIQFYGGTTLR